jgi:nitrite reductase/ring-hydroxylating ferredoxin subunit
MLVKSSTNSPPPRDQFPEYPASWYLFCESRELHRQPLSKHLLGRQLVAFRTATGKVAVLDAQCSHLGADLGCGRILGETIQCPFHHWRYGTDGACVDIPGAREIPAFARLRNYPVEERHGLVFVFNGRQALFPLPFVLGENPTEFVAAPPFRYVADCTWYMNAAHAFDTRHFAAVHDRKLTGPPQIDCPAPFARRNSYHAEVIGQTVFDRLLRVFAGRTVHITLTIWGGTFAVITSDFPRVHSAFLMPMLPLENGQTLCEGIVLARRGRTLSLPIRRLFTHGYLADEARRLRSTRYNPASLMEQDQDMIDFFNWVVSLPPPSSTTNPQENYEANPNSLDAVLSERTRLVAGRCAT